ncbi:hypothetical protein [Telmatospirillum siberiense]|uniref:Secreted protein n=1 Tax=Telmatospirillum siberiense TaxID=382514 RepID=A0A2N3PUS2_9PROT|nr:hypothetical protein [Telmatospirillum siberiense]PKU24144.1 hypothetical protein CWS72_12445 [Telmatospirillum siberiense]
MTRRISAGRWLFCLATLLPSAAAMAETSVVPPDTPAQIALFDSDHLGNITAPVRLDYSFVRQGDPARTYDDRVSADIRTLRDNGGKDVWTDFLSGDRRMPTPPVSGFHGNPLLMFFLEHDVLEMRQETGRPATYFRNRIRRAFLDGAQVSQITLDLQGRTAPATEIDITPFRDDPALTELPTVAGKSYRFVLSAEVPGTLYQISSHAPPSAGAAGIDEVMTFAGKQP